MDIWKPEESYGKIKRVDGATIQYAPNLGFWNDKSIEIAYEKVDSIELDKNLPHYHKNMEEIYMIISGQTILLMDESEEVLLKPREVATIEAGEIHRLFEVVEPEKNGPLEFFLAKSSSTKDDKFNVETSYVRKVA